MGNEFVKCCHQTLSIDDDDDDDDKKNRDTELTDTAKALYEIDKSKQKKHNHDQQSLSNSASKKTKKTKSKRNVKKSELNKQHKNKKSQKQHNKRQQKRSFSVEAKSNHKETELKATKTEIEILKKQNEILRKQNEEFLLKYGAFFTSSSSINTLNTQNSLTTDLSQKSQISYLNEYDEEPMSPLSPLITNAQSNMILSYANTVSHGGSSTVPVLKTHSSEHGSGNIHSLCIHIGSCKSVKRIINALKWYSLCGGDQDILLNKLMESKYDKYLLSDYQHVINRHELIQENRINHANKEYKLIKTQIKQQIEPCDVKICNGYKRYKRLSPKSNDLMDIMDLIHCVLIHSEYNKLLKIYI